MAERAGKCAVFDKDGAARAAEVLKAIAHPVRLEIVALLHREGEMTVGDLMGALGGRQSITSQQLNLPM